MVSLSRCEGKVKFRESRRGRGWCEPIPAVTRRKGSCPSSRNIFAVASLLRHNEKLNSKQRVKGGKVPPVRGDEDEWWW